MASYEYYFKPPSAPYDWSFEPTDLVPDMIRTPRVKNLPISASDKEISDKEIFDNTDVHGPVEALELCRACGWNTRHECEAWYLPRLRIFSTLCNKGLWVMGNDWFIRDRTENASGNEFMTYQFLKKQGTKHIPLVKEMVEFKDENGGYNFVVSSRAKGVSLARLWRKSSREQKMSYVKQIAAALRELRQFTAEYPQKVDGSPLWDNMVGHWEGLAGQWEPGKKCIKIGRTAEEWFDNMDKKLREGLSRILQTEDASVIDTRLQQLKVRFDASL